MCVSQAESGRLTTIFCLKDIVQTKMDFLLTNTLKFNLNLVYYRAAVLVNWLLNVYFI